MQSAHNNSKRMCHECNTETLHKGEFDRYHDVYITCLKCGTQRMDDGDPMDFMLF